MPLLGLDGGATKTAGVLVDEHGREVARALAGRSAIIGDPSPESCEVLRSVVDSLCAQAGVTREAITWCGLGLNGIDFEDEFPSQHALLSAAIGLDPARVALVNDGVIALWGASPARASLIIQHGSGFTSAYRADYGGETIFDGLSVGDVFDIRYRLIPLVARMIQGMVPPTPLKDAVLAFFEVEEARYCEAIYRHWIPRERYLSTVPLVFSAWQQGDPGAAALVEGAIADYALFARTMIAKIGSDHPAVALGGGQLRAAPEAFWELLTARIREHCPGLTASSPMLPPDLGAALLAAYHAGLPPAGFFAQLQQGYEAQRSTP